ncbi:12125_t:CDS:2 [Gigaspora margarita]|uniref:12125_t:CDS:1 n=1 Tax=Gigaspora margarita TaxID=4874 RepID=A0ABN7V048_GIGMA|nr:12125_t:CDS:2 [Gigaspora margarita]
MGHTKKSTFIPTHRGTKHTLPSIDLLEEQTNFPSTSIMESNLDMLDDNGILPDPESSDNENSYSSTIKSMQEDTISQVIYGIIKKTKYPNDELLMKVCYEALVAMKGDEFKNKIKYISLLNMFIKQLRDFADKQEVILFKKSKIQFIPKYYLKLNKQFDDSDLNYTYLDLIIDCIFPDLKTEKNSIVFGIAVALNYLDLSKEVNIVPSKVAKYKLFSQENAGS